MKNIGSYTIHFESQISEPSEKFLVKYFEQEDIQLHDHDSLTQQLRGIPDGIRRPKTGSHLRRGISPSLEGAYWNMGKSFTVPGTQGWGFHHREQIVLGVMGTLLQTHTDCICMHFS